MNTMVSTMNPFLLKALQIATVGAALLAANPSQAAIIETSIQGGYKNEYQPLNLTIIDPPPTAINLRNYDGYSTGGVIINNPDLNRDMRGIIEQQSVKLSKAINVWSSLKDDILVPSAPTNLTIAQDTIVSSYLFYVNPPAQESLGKGRFNWFGEFKFDAPILGLVGGGYGGIHNKRWQPTNQLLGVEGSRYNVRAGLDAYQDVVTFKDNILTFNIFSRTGTEPFRVITAQTPVIVPTVTQTFDMITAQTPVAAAAAPVPEPLTILGSIGAIGFGVLFRRERSQGDTKKELK